jgi:hypothetical protein
MIHSEPKMTRTAISTPKASDPPGRRQPKP